MIRYLVVALVIAAFVWLALRLGRGEELFRIDVRGRKTTMRGAIPARSRAELTGFIDDLGLLDGARIAGYRRGESVRIAFSGAVPESERQRIRNFLLLRR